MLNMAGRPWCQTMETSMEEAPHCTSLGPVAFPCFVFCLSLKRGGNRRAFRLPGEGGDHFHCALEPSPRDGGHALDFLT